MDNEATKNSHTGYQICHMNVRSLLRHKDEVVATMCGNEIICLSETWLTNMVTENLIDITNYKYIRQDRDNTTHQPNVKSRGGGLMIYYKEFYTPYITNMFPLNTVSKHIEQLWIKLEQPGRKRLYVSVIYRPPDGKIEEFIRILRETIEHLYSLHNNRFELIISGDFNIDYAKNRNPDRRALKELADDLNLTQLISTPTRVTNKCKSTIDLIFTNIDKDKIKRSGVLDIIISDHLPIFINVKRSKTKHTKTKIHSRSYNLYTYENFKNILLTNHNWRIFWLKDNTIIELWEIMLEIIVDSLDSICPKQTSFRRQDQQSWIDKELLNAISHKNGLYKRIRKTNESVDLWDSYKAQRTLVRRLLVTKRRSYITKTLNENRDDPKSFWKEINTNLGFGKKSGNPTAITIMDENDNKVEGRESANAFNAHYVTVGKKLADNLAPAQQTAGQPTPCPLPLPYRPMTFRFVTVKEVTSLIKSLKNSKPSGVPSLKTSILKDALIILIVEFTFIINECLDKSYIPDNWKKGIISPIPKINKCTSPIDFRPITVLPAASKVLERAVYNQLVYFLESNGVLDCRQHGFRKNYSTLSAVYDVTQHMYQNMDQRKLTYCAFIDYSKAFDTLNHTALFEKLRKIGLNQQIQDWCKCYLTGRMQQVKVGDVLSDELVVTCGVPQGSILGPLFFVLYVNDLLQLFNENDPKITLYADDTVLYVSNSDARVACDKLERGLHKLHTWCVRNKLSINIKKTKLLVVDPLKLDDVYPRPKLNGQFLDRVDSYNYLGVSIDNNLSFEKFLREKYGKVYSRVYQLGKMRKYIEPNTANLIYKQMILSLFDYADAMVKSGPQRDISRLVKLQEKAVKIIDNNCNRTVSLEGLMQIYRIQPIGQRQDEHLCSLMYRLSKDPALLNHSRPRVRLRCHNKIKFKKYKRTYQLYLKSPLARGTSLWDRLPEAVQKSTTKFKFKKHICEILY